MQSERISYPFKSKRLITSRKQHRPKPLTEIFGLPEKPHTVRADPPSTVDRIVRKSRLKFKQ